MIRIANQPKRGHPATMPTVAVVIPSCNRCRLLLQAMESIAIQTRRPDEVVIVDDASTVDMSECRVLAGEFGFKWCSLPANQGPAAARNRGVEATTADWLCFLDSDDEWLPEKLSRQLSWHEQHPDSRISQVHESWHRKGEEVKKPSHWEQRGGDLFAASIERCSIGPSCVMLSRELWNETGGFDENFRVCEDYELWLRISSQALIGLVDSGPLVRKHAGHDDQLSAVTPAMDRFRVHALMKAFAEGSYSETQMEMFAEGIRGKAVILAGGAEKRGFRERADFYRRVSEVRWEILSAGETREWFRRSARLIQE